MPEGPARRGFLGREEELALLGGALEEARSGRSAAVVLSGDSGVGKTRLVQEFANRARSAGTRVLAASCADFGEDGPSFWPFVDVMRNLARGSDAEQVAELLQPVVTGFGRSLEQLGHFIYEPAADSRVRNPQMFGLALELLSSLAAVDPVLLVVEDLHWVDRSTRDLLRFLLANLVHDRVLIVGTYAGDTIVRGHPLQQLLVEWRRNPRVEFLDVAPFTRAELALLVEAVLGKKADEGLVDLTWSRSGGNPFFAEELVAAIGAGESRQLPASLRQVLSSRVDVGSREAREVLAIVATGGEGVSHDLLASIVQTRRAAAGGPDPTGLLGALRECVESNVLVVDEHDHYWFRHRLLAEVVYDQLLPGERRDLHAALARALSVGADGSDPVVITKVAHHLYAAGDAPPALHAAVEAAGAMGRVHGFAEAGHHYERAVELWDQVDAQARPAGLDRTALLERAAQSADLAGEPRHASALLAAAVSGAGDGVDPERAALLRQQLGRYLWASGNSREALDTLDAAVALLPDAGAGETRARVMGAHAEVLMLAGRYRRSREVAETAVDTARAAGSDAVEARALATLGFDLAYLGDPDAGVAALERALEIAEAIGTPADVGRAYLNLADVLSGPLNRLAAAVTVAQRGAERAAQLGLARSYGVALQAIAVNTLFRLGRWNEADDVLVQAFAHRPTGTAAIDLCLARARVAVGRGEFGAAESDFETVESMSTDVLASRYQVPLLTLHAGLDLWRGRPDRAGEAVAAGIEVCAGESDDVWLLAPLLWHGLRAEGDRAERARGRRVEAELADAHAAGSKLLAQAQGLAVESRDTAPAIRLAIGAYLDLCRGEWSRVEGVSAPEAWEEAAGAWRALEQPYPTAYARWRQAEALLAQRTQSGAAAAALREAYSIAGRLGAEPFRALVVELAARARVQLDAGSGPAAAAPAVPFAARPGASPIGGLTRREVNVLLLVAEGRSNREIAEQLFISEKTASVHVSHILAKLGVRTRVQAVALAHRMGVNGPTDG